MSSVSQPPAGPVARPPEYPAATDARIRIWEYVWIVWKRLWCIPAMVLLSVLVALLIPREDRVPMYRAKCEVVVNAPVAMQATLSVRSDIHQLDMKTQVRVLESRSLARSVVEKLRLDQDPEFMHGRASAAAAVPIPAAPEDALAPEPAGTAAKEEGAASPAIPDVMMHRLVDRLMEGVYVEQEESTNVVNIVYMARTPRLAARLANAIAETAIEMDVEANIEATIRTIEWLREQQSKFREVNTRNEEELQRLEKELDIVTLGREREAKAQDLLFAELASLGTEIVEARQESRRIGIRYDQLSDMRKAGQSLTSVMEIGEDPEVLRLLGVRAAAEQEIKTLADIAGPKNQEVGRLKKRLELVQQELEARIQQILDRLNIRRQHAQNREKKLESEIANVQAKLDELNEKGRRYMALKREIEMNTEIYDLLLKRVKETSMAGAFRVSRFRIISRATPPRSPVLFGPTGGIKTALIVGLVLGFTLIFALEYLNPRVKGTDDIENNFGLNVLATVKTMPRDMTGKARALICRDRPRSDFAETFRSLHVRLTTSRDPVKQLLITSPSPGDGKTIVAMNLATAVAESGKRVLVIDGDFRKPMVGPTMEIEREQDLIKVLEGEATLKEAIVPSDVEHVDLLITNHVGGARVAAVLRRDRIEQVLQEAADEYDLVVVDSSPALLFGETGLMASIVKETILVVRENETSNKVLLRTLLRLREVEAKTLGVVINHSRVGAQSYFYYYPHYRR